MTTNIISRRTITIAHGGKVFRFIEPWFEFDEIHIPVVIRTVYPLSLDQKHVVKEILEKKREEVLNHGKRIVVIDSVNFNSVSVLVVCGDQRKEVIREAISCLIDIVKDLVDEILYKAKVEVHTPYTFKEIYDKIVGLTIEEDELSKVSPLVTEFEFTRPVDEEWVKELEEAIYSLVVMRLCGC